MKKKTDNQIVQTKESWHTLSKQEVFEKLECTQAGLSSQEGKARLEKYGNNTLPKKKTKSIVLMFLEELINPIVLILLAAMAFSFIVKEWLDGFVILGIVLIDAIMGASQAKKAQRVASSLSNISGKATFANSSIKKWT